MSTIDPNNLTGTAHLTFDDEFNTLNLWNGSSGTWNTESAWGLTTDNGFSLTSNSEQEWYINSNYAPTSEIKPWTVSNGVLNLTGSVIPTNLQSAVDNYQYASGQINTSKSFSQTYGYFEVNAKLPAGQGFWPAFWLMPENGSWPPELDVMENLGNNTSTYYTTVHYNSNNQYESQAVTPGVDLSAGFHTYGVDWEPDHITWYLDGKQVYQVATPADMNTPMYMILNLALGGSWPGNLGSSSELPNSMQVDWVRVYQSGPATSSGGTTTGSTSTGTTGAGTTSTSTGSTSTGSTTPTTTTTAGETLQAPNDSGSTLTGGAGNDTLIASHGADTLTGGAGSDTFEFPVIPWSAGHVTDFAPGVDKLDLAPLFHTYGYTGSNPVGDGWLSFGSDGHGGTDVYFNPHNGSNSGYPYLITDLNNVSPSSIEASRDVIYSDTQTTTSGSTSTGTWSDGSTSTGTSTTAPGETLQAPNNNGSTLTGGAGNDTLIASYGADTLTGGAGSDTFEFQVIPWSAGHITDFAPGVDKLDLATLFHTYGYTGSNPVGDGWLSFASDSHGGTDVYFNPHNGSNSGYPYLITDLNNVSPSSIEASRDVIYSDTQTTTSGSTTGASSTSTSTPASVPGETLQAPNNNGTTLTGGAGNDTLIASYGADTLTGGGGSDTFEFPVIPWSAGHVTDFTPGVDALDLAPLFHTYGYTGSNPIGDGWVSFGSDGNGGTDVYFNPHNGSNSGYAYLITDLQHVTPGQIQPSHDLIFH